MNAAAWTCLLLPLASTVALTLGGTRISRRLAATSRRPRPWGAFAVRGSSPSCSCSAMSAGRSHPPHHLVDVALGRAVPLRVHAAHRSAEHRDDVDRRRLGSTSSPSSIVKPRSGAPLRHSSLISVELGDSSGAGSLSAIARRVWPVSTCLTVGADRLAVGTVEAEAVRSGGSPRRRGNHVHAGGAR